MICHPELVETHLAMESCGNSPVALCCVPSLSLLARCALEWIHIFGLRPDLSPAALVAKRVAEVEARLQFATQNLWALIWVWKGCGNTFVTLCCLPPMSLLARNVLKWIHILALDRSQSCSYGGKAGSQGGRKAAICNPGVWKGYRATLLWHCCDCQPCPYWPGGPWNGSTFWLGLDLTPATAFLFERCHRG